VSELDATAFLPQLLSQAFDRVMDDLYDHLVQAGFGDLRATHCLHVFRHMDCGGTRPSTLARRAGMTPQAMSELVAYLEARGYVRRVADPSDGRGRVVVYADRGTEAAEAATQFFAAQDVRWAAVVGDDRLAEVKSALAAVLGEAPDAGASAPAAS
jgi:DNA-binding MarR family transcriptional regulator